MSFCDGQFILSLTSCNYVLIWILVGMEHICLISYAALQQPVINWWMMMSPEGRVRFTCPRWLVQTSGRLITSHSIINVGIWMFAGAPVIRLWWRSDYESGWGRTFAEGAGCLLVRYVGAKHIAYSVCDFGFIPRTLNCWSSKFINSSIHQCAAKFKYFIRPKPTFFVNFILIGKLRYAWPIS